MHLNKSSMLLPAPMHIHLTLSFTPTHPTPTVRPPICPAQRVWRAGVVDLAP
jgi:hypothetical protein